MQASQWPRRLWQCLLSFGRAWSPSSSEKPVLGWRERGLCLRVMGTQLLCCILGYGSHLSGAITIRKCSMKVRVPLHLDSVSLG